MSHNSAFFLGCTWEFFASSVKIEFLESSQTATIDIFACGKNGENVITEEENGNVVHYCDFKTDRIVVPAGAKQTHTLQGYMFVSIADTNPMNVLAWWSTVPTSIQCESCPAGKSSRLG